MKNIPSFLLLIGLLSFQALTQAQPSPVAVLKHQIVELISQKSELASERAEILRSFQGPYSIIKDLQEEWISIKDQVAEDYRAYYQQKVKCEGFKTELTVLKSQKLWEVEPLEIPINEEASGALIPTLTLSIYQNYLKSEQELVLDQQAFYIDYLRQERAHQIVADGLLYRLFQVNSTLQKCQKNNIECRSQKSAFSILEKEFSNFQYQAITFSLGKRVPYLHLDRFQQQLLETISEKKQIEDKITEEQNRLLLLKKQCEEKAKSLEQSIKRKLTQMEDLGRIIDEQLGVRDILLLTLKNKTNALRIKTIEMENLAQQYSIQVRNL